MRRVDYSVARRLYHLVRDPGFPPPDIAFHQPVFARGDGKRLLELAEAGPAFVQAGLISEEDLLDGLRSMRRLAAGDAVVAIMPRMAQVSAVKRAA